MSSNQQQAQPENPEQAARQRGEAALQARILGNRDSFAGHEVADTETGEKVDLVEHSDHVTVDHIRTLLWKQVEQKFQHEDAAQAEALVAEITGNHSDVAENEQAEEENMLTQQERLAKAETQLKEFFDKLAKELTPLINARSARLMENESIGERTTEQLGERGDVNILLANEAIAKKMVEAFQKNGMAFSGYERAFNDSTREGFVLENKESGLRFMFVYDQAMPKEQKLAKPEAPVAQPDQANAQMPDQAAPEHTTEAAADTKSEVQDRTATAKRAAAAQQQAANDPPEIEALFGSGAAQAAQRQAANERPTEDDKKKSA